MENINMHTIYKEEVKQREYILQKVRNNIKISSDERLWLSTHPLYNQRYEIIAFNIAIEHLSPNKWHFLRIKVESVLYDNRFVPIIGVPDAKGRIVTDLELTRNNQRIKSNKGVKMLGFEIDVNNCEFEVEYISDSGLLSVHYECDYYDAKQNLHKREASSTGNPDFAMIREVVDDHTIRYHCKSPVTESFEAFVFSIQWKEEKQ